MGHLVLGNISPQNCVDVHVNMIAGELTLVTGSEEGNCRIYNFLPTFLTKCKTLFTSPLDKALSNYQIGGQFNHYEEFVDVGRFEVPPSSNIIVAFVKPNCADLDVRIVLRRDWCGFVSDGVSATKFNSTAFRGFALVCRNFNFMEMYAKNIR